MEPAGVSLRPYTLAQWVVVLLPSKRRGKDSNLRKLTPTLHLGRLRKGPEHRVCDYTMDSGPVRWTSLG